MGYRSQVVLAVSKELMPHFLAVMAKNPEARELVFAHNDELDQDYCEGHFFVRWESIKWYEDFKDIGAIQNFVDAADCDDFPLDDNDGSSSENFKFVRIGEDSSDIACHGHGFDHIYPYTNINW